MSFKFDNRWGPASVISALVLCCTIIVAYANSNSTFDKRLTTVETQIGFILQSQIRIEQKIDKRFP